MKRIPLILLLISITSLYAQEQEWYIEKPIVDIFFEGLNTVSKNELLGLMQPYLEQGYTDSLSWEIQSKLYALDYFDLIVPEIRRSEDIPDAVVLVFAVKEKPMVSDIRFDGNVKMRRGEMLDAILVSKGDFYNPGTLNADAQAIKDLYIEKGFIDADVTADGQVDEALNQAVVTFSINEGSQTKISEINFQGNDTYVQDKTLRNLMKTKTQSLFNKGVYVEAQLQEDIKAIEQLYGDQGLIDAKVLDIKKDIVFNEKDNLNQMIITVIIEEGEPWKFGGITITGNQIYTTEELMEDVTLEPGETLVLTDFQQDYEKIRDRYLENGYIFNTFNYTEQRNAEAKTVSYNIEIVERDRAHIENIIVRGNSKTKSYIILREFPLEEGEVFSKQKIFQGTMNLYNLQYFDSIEPTPYPGSQEGLMDLVIDVTEGKTSNISLGISFTGGTELPISGKVTWSDKNFLGRGQILSIQGSLAATTQQASVQFSEPKLFGLRWGGGVSLSYTHRLRSGVNQDRNFNGVPDPYITWEEYNNASDRVPLRSQMKYDSHTLGLGLNTGYTWITRIGRFAVSTGLKFGLDYVVYDSGTYTPHNFLIRDNLDTWKYNDSISLTLSWDTRDLQYDPNKGFLLSQTLSLAGILEPLSNRNYIKSITRFNFHLKLFEIPIGTKGGSFKSVFSIKSAFSAIFDKPWKTPQGDIAETNGFVIDGMFIARGWPSQTSDYYRYMWNNTAQLKFPIIKNILSFDIFLDAVGVWENTTGDSSALDNWSGNDWRFSLGAGFRFANPQFPIGIYLVKRFQWKDGQFTWFPDDPGNTWYEFKESGLDLVIAFDLDIY